MRFTVFDRRASRPLPARRARPRAASGGRRCDRASARRAALPWRRLDERPLGRRVLIQGPVQLDDGRGHGLVESPSCDTNNKVLTKSRRITSPRASARPTNPNDSSAHLKLERRRHSVMHRRARRVSPPPLKSATRRSWRCSTFNFAAAVATAASTAQPSVNSSRRRALEALAILSSAGFALRRRRRRGVAPLLPRRRRPRPGARP